MIYTANPISFVHLFLLMLMPCSYCARLLSFLFFFFFW